jgi:Nucleoside-diphosphate-sugar epimerases
MTAANPARNWIVGCGDVGCRLGLRLADAGAAVRGFVRSAAGLERLERLGLDGQRLDLDAEAIAPLAQEPIGRLFYLVPPARDGVTDRRLRAFLAALPSPPARLVYLSTSAVYGDCGGDWVDESAPLNPGHDRGRRRVDAERAVREYADAQGVRGVIARVPGIYGPGRLPEQRLRARQPLVMPGQSPWSNRIHAEDLVTALLCLAERGTAGAAYNVSDGRPTTMTDYLQACARRLGLPSPPLAPLERVRESAGPMLREFLSESRRLDNGALRALGWQPRYPSVEEGLAQATQEDRVVTATGPRID